VGDLVTYFSYCDVTKDFTTPLDRVMTALSKAISTAEERTNRTFRKGDYTEVLYVYPNNRVYPAATPIASVQTGQGAFRIEGDALWIGWFDPYPVVNVGEVGGIGGFPPQATVTYTGGYEDGALPQELNDAICAVAWRRTHPVVLEGLPVGAGSPHVGDVGFTSSGALAAISPNIETATAQVFKKYARPSVRAWHR
jgi:hypothetical protein